MELLSIKDLEVRYEARDRVGRKATLRAVDGVDLSVNKGETVGLVGESGCGKTTLGNSVIGLAEASAGKISYNGRDVAELLKRHSRHFRREVQMIFQDPFGSLNPRMTVGSAIGEVLRVHRLVKSRSERKERIGEALESVGLKASHASRYPHEFSGGQRQRLGIARALVLDPSLVIADEPVSALDVSVQVQILNLMLDLQMQRNLSYLFIAHDLAVVKYMCDRIMVMYLGKIVENAAAADIFASPAHPYTEALLSAVPDVVRGLEARSSGSRRIVLKGDVPSGTEKIAGCPFHPRCHRARELCRERVPPRKTVASNHTSVCHFAEEVLSQGAVS
jgi:oligopeptide/dipeptide ABC transporter ATP-binding protein